MSYWGVMQLESQRMALALLLLKRAGYETYAPRIQLRRSHGRKRYALLFPGYAFVRIVDRFYAIKFTPGVVRLLMDGDKPARMPEQVIKNLLGRETNGVIKLPPKTLKPGARVRITGGPFAGHLALYDGMSGQDRQRVLLEFLSGVVTLDLPKRDVEPLDVASWSVLSY